MEEALREIASMRLFARLSRLDANPDETTILDFRRLLETHGLAAKRLDTVNAHLARKGQSLRAGTNAPPRAGITPPYPAAHAWPAPPPDG